MRPACVAVCIVFGLAVARTSVGTPWTTCWASVSDPPKLNRTVTPGLACSNRGLSWL
jgi:hypothetical protein